MLAYFEKLAELNWGRWQLALDGCTVLVVQPVLHNICLMPVLQANIYCRYRTVGTHQGLTINIP
jgi:hypothetical protein